MKQDHYYRITYLDYDALDKSDGRFFVEKIKSLLVEESFDHSNIWEIDYPIMAATEFLHDEKSNEVNGIYMSLEYLYSYPPTSVDYYKEHARARIKELIQEALTNEHYDAVEQLAQIEKSI